MWIGCGKKAAYPTGAETQVRWKPERGYAEMELITEDGTATTPELTESLDELAREGARRMIVAALELEVDEYVSKMRNLRDEDGHALVVRNGHPVQYPYRPSSLGTGRDCARQERTPSTSSSRPSTKRTGLVYRCCVHGTGRDWGTRPSAVLTGLRGTGR